MATCASPALPCCPFLIERVVLLAEQALPAAGAAVLSAAEALPAGTKEVVFWLTYTQGAAGGYPAISVIWGNGTENSFDAVLDLSSFTVAGELGETDIYVNSLNGVPPPDGNALSWVEPFKVPAGATSVVLSAREVGVVGTPGTIVAALTGAGGGGW